METSETRNAPATAPASATVWRDRWWVIFDVRIGVLPLPVYVVLLLVLAAMAASGKLDADLPTGIALVAVGGFTCAELARRIPWIRHIGATSIFAAFLPSALIYYHLMPASVVKSVTSFTKSTNFLYLFIAAIIVGSVLSMDRQTLIKGFVKIFVPVCAGSLAAALIGTGVGAALGLGAKHTLFFCGRANHGGWCGRRRFAAVDGLRADARRGAGTAVRAGLVRGHARQHCGYLLRGFAELRRHEKAGVDRQRPTDTQRRSLASGDFAGCAGNV